MLKKRVGAFICCAMLLMAIPCAEAVMPREIVPLDYDSLVTRQGQHHYLFACVDTWQGSAGNLGNTDGIILVTMDVRANRLIFTTFTREMLVMKPDGGIGRMTYLAKNYGPDALARVIGTHFGVKVSKYIIFSMDNVQQIIDVMGGVYITVTDAEAAYLNRYRISRTSTTPSMDRGGTYLFSGHAAVIYMRIRKVGNDGDSGRTRRMRTVMATLAHKFSDITLSQSMDILGSVSENLVITNMTMMDFVDALGYAMQLRGVTPEGLQMPPDGAMEPIVYAGMQTRQVDFIKSREVLHAFLDTMSFEVMDD